MLEEDIKQSNESNIKRNLDIIRRYSRLIHALVIISKVLIILSGLFHLHLQGLKLFGF